MRVSAPPVPICNHRQERRRPVHRNTLSPDITPCSPRTIDWHPRRCPRPNDPRLRHPRISGRRRTGNTHRRRSEGRAQSTTDCRRSPTAPPRPRLTRGSRARPPLVLDDVPGTVHVPQTHGLNSSPEATTSVGFPRFQWPKGSQPDPQAVERVGNRLWHIMEAHVGK